MEVLRWQGDASLQGRVRAWTLQVHGVRVVDDGKAYEQLERLGKLLGDMHRETQIGLIDGIGEARRLYRAFGIDPTRTRPSSEALLRRCRKSQDLYRINNIVDVGNWVSLEYLLPLGLYDCAHINGSELTVRVGNEGEEYEGIRKGPVHVGGRLCVADADGAMGSPTSDSLRTSIRETTTDIAAIVFAPTDGEPDRLESATRALAERIVMMAGGDLVAMAELETL